MKLIEFPREGKQPVYINPDMVISVHAFDRTNRKTNINLVSNGGDHLSTHTVDGPAEEVAAALQA